MSQSPRSSKVIQQDSSNSSTNIRKRGQWNSTRRLAAIDAMLKYRPFEQKQTKKGPTWKKIFNAVNNTYPHLKSLGQSAIREQINKLVIEAKENRQSPFMFETLLEKRALELALLIEEEAVFGVKKRIGKRRQKLIQERRDLLERCNIHVSTPRTSNNINPAQQPIINDSNRHPAETEHSSENHSVLESDFKSALIDFGDKQAKQIQQFDQTISHISKSDETLKKVSLQLQMMSQQQHLFFTYMSRKFEEVTAKVSTPPYILPNSHIRNKPA